MCFMQHISPADTKRFIFFLFFINVAYQNSLISKNIHLPYQKASTMYFNLHKIHIRIARSFQKENLCQLIII